MNDIALQLQILQNDVLIRNLIIQLKRSQLLLLQALLPKRNLTASFVLIVHVNHLIIVISRVLIVLPAISSGRSHIFFVTRERHTISIFILNAILMVFL